MASRASTGTVDVCKECGGKIIYSMSRKPLDAEPSAYFYSHPYWFHIRDGDKRSVGYEADRHCFPDTTYEEDWALHNKRAVPVNYCPERQDSDGQLCNRKNREGRAHCGIHDRYVREREEANEFHLQNMAMTKEFTRLVDEIVEKIKELGLEAERYEGRSYMGGPDGRVIIDGVELLELLEAKVARRVSGPKRGRQEPQSDVSN